MVSYDPEWNKLRAVFDPLGAKLERMDEEYRRQYGERSPSRWPEPTVETPSEEDVARAAAFGDLCETSDGCLVEPDGICEHGHPTWARRFGFI